MSKVCKLMIFVAAFGLSFVGNAFADEPVPVVDTQVVNTPVVDTQAVAQTTDVAKDVKTDENKVVKEEKKVKKHHRKKHEKKAEHAEHEKEMQAKDLHEKDKQ